jgi:tetratricopeptide (TPR) repeat protein
MTDFDLAHDTLRTVTLYRRKGDAAAQRDNDDAAKEAWQVGLDASAEVFTTLAIPITVDTDLARGYNDDIATEAAELLGVRGGLLRRLGRPREALESYRNGAVWETSHNLPYTYNRMNAFKLALIVGDQTLAQLRDELTRFHHVLEKLLSTNERAADDAWLWADLGDVCLLLGDKTGAISAYQDFVARARSESAVAALTVLNEVVQALVAREDADAARTATALAEVEAIIRGR